MSIYKEGGFNTGRLYSNLGQRIYWWQDTENFVAFYDVDRMIIGMINDPFDNLGAPAHWITAQYDKGNYSMACQPKCMPANFDFGPHLRI